MNADTRWDETFDVVVLRAGAGGMSAALVSVLEGRRVLLLESTQQVGGTAARSSGTVWIPNNTHQRHLDPRDDAAAARSYLDALVSDRAAVKVVPTPLGTSMGVRTDAIVRALANSGRPIPGLYVCGNDMQSIMGGEYPGPGAQIGIAMTFGYLAARHATARDARIRDNPAGEAPSTL